MTLKKLPKHDFIYGRFSSDDRLTSYKVKIGKKGYPQFVKAFANLEDAKAAVHQIMFDQSNCVKANRLSAERTTLGDVLQQFVIDLRRGIIPQTVSRQRQ